MYCYAQYLEYALKDPELFDKLFHYVSHPLLIDKRIKDLCRNTKVNISQYMLDKGKINKTIHGLAERFKSYKISEDADEESIMARFIRTLKPEERHILALTLTAIAELDGNEYSDEDQVLIALLKKEYVLEVSEHFSKTVLEMIG